MELPQSPALATLLKVQVNQGNFFQSHQLKNLPVDGLPRRFEIRSDRRDAWNLYANQAVGSVWISRKGSTEVSAWSTSCPHAGCMVQLASNHNHFQCPCHNSRFEINGKRMGPQNPSSRDMDRLEVEIREGEEVWVRFERFKSGISKSSWSASHETGKRWQEILTASMKQLFLFLMPENDTDPKG